MRSTRAVCLVAMALLGMVCAANAQCTGEHWCRQACAQHFVRDCLLAATSLDHKLWHPVCAHGSWNCTHVRVPQTQSPLLLCHLCMAELPCACCHVICAATTPKLVLTDASDKTDPIAQCLSSFSLAISGTCGTTIDTGGWCTRGLWHVSAAPLPLHAPYCGWTCPCLTWQPLFSA
jgi:hypothetical protein